MKERFNPSSGYFRHDVSFGGWAIKDNNGGMIGFVPLAPGRDIWQTECDAMLMAGGPEMLETLVRVHNHLNIVSPVSHDPVATVRKIQGSIRGGLVKVIGASERLTAAGIILPEGHDGK